MSVWSDAFDAAFNPDTPQWQPLVDAVEYRTGRVVTQDWVASRVDDAMAQLRLYAPCKRTLWLTPADLPADVAGVLGAALSRTATNPDGIRTIQAGEFSQTWAGSGSDLSGMFTPVEQRVIGVAAGCGSVRSVRGVVDAPIPGFAGVTDALEQSRPQPCEVRDGG